MSHAVSFDEQENVINITIRDKFNLLSVMDVASQVVRIAKERGSFRILNDARDSTANLSILQIYELPKVFLEILAENGLNVLQFKRAIVVSKDIDKFGFFETVSVNQGQNVMMFHDLQSAKEWLLQK